MPDRLLAEVVHMGSGNDGLGRIEQDPLGGSTMASEDHPKNGDLAKSRKTGRKGVVFAVDPVRDLLSVRWVDTNEVRCYSTEQFKNAWELISEESPPTSQGKQPNWAQAGCLVVPLLFLLVFGFVISKMVGCMSGSDQTHGGGFVAGNHVKVTDDMWCMVSKDALSDLIGAADTEEKQRVFIEKGVTILSQGEDVKVLDLSFTGAKVRTPSGQECWVVTNVLQGTR